MCTAQWSRRPATHADRPSSFVTTRHDTPTTHHFKAGGLLACRSKRQCPSQRPESVQIGRSVANTQNPYLALAKGKQEALSASSERGDGKSSNKPGPDLIHLGPNAIGGGPMMDYRLGVICKLRPVPRSHATQAGERQSDRYPTSCLIPSQRRPAGRSLPPIRPSPAGCPTRASSEWRRPRSAPTSGCCPGSRLSPHRTCPARTS